MPMYKMPFNDIATGAVADTFKTMAALIVADVAGQRMRVRSLTAGSGSDTPVDRNVSVQLARIADVSAGTAGTAAQSVSGANMSKVDPGSVDSIVTGKRDYSVEPTVYETEDLFQIDFNARSGFIKEWSAEQAPAFTRDQLCGVLVAPRTANADSISGTIEIEVF